ncbi:MAG: nitronate monooxygenase [Clostridiales Family XIII bacterium]|jgi:NAD(P)H-dependent flavin oxidoreductase YrpB (nitropropane dioxygenase family)/DNA-binding MarR family transcriptional regulator|nr:nitronate monooxygenase [Clostridiales Family XIII bacterium]
MRKTADRANEILTRLLRTVLKTEEEALRHSPQTRGLTPGEIHALTAIGTGRAKTMTQVAAGLKISVGALTTTMNKLVKKGFVRRFRVAEDRRIVKAELTETGLAAVCAHAAFREKTAAGAFAALTGDQQETFVRFLENIEEYYAMQAVRPVRTGPDLALLPVRIGDLEIAAPIFQGDLGPAFSTPGLAAAVAAQGGVGVLSSTQPGFSEPDYERDPEGANRRALKRNIRAALRRRREFCTGGEPPAGSGAIAVNILCASAGYEDLVRTAVKAGAQIIISGAGVPGSLPGIVGDAGVKLVPIVSSARAVAVLRKRWAKKYNRAPDAVIFEGPGKSGHLGFKEEHLEAAADRFYQNILEIRRELADLPNCPLIVGNGRLNREDVKKLLAYGADGVQIEEQFAAAEECDAPAGVRAVYRAGGARESLLVKSPLGMPVRILRNRLAARILEGSAWSGRCIGCLDSCPKKDISFCLAETLAQTARGDAENGILFCGKERTDAPAGDMQAAPLTVAEIFAELCG